MLVLLVDKIGAKSFGLALDKQATGGKRWGKLETPLRSDEPKWPLPKWDSGCAWLGVMMTLTGSSGEEDDILGRHGHRLWAWDRQEKRGHAVRDGTALANCCCCYHYCCA